MANLAAPAILDELRKSAIPLVGKALLAGLSIEAGPSGFLSLYGDSAAQPNAWGGPLDAFPDWPGVKTRTGWTHAFGAWQDQPETYREAAARTGHAGVAPQDQIINNWDVAQHDFRARSGLDLTETLLAGRLPIAQVYLAATWPLGANAGLPARYADNLAALGQPAPVPPPPDPVLFAGRDGAGNPIEIVLHRASAATTAAVALGLLGASALSPHGANGGALHAAPPLVQAGPPLVQAGPLWCKPARVTARAGASARASTAG